MTITTFIPVIFKTTVGTHVPANTLRAFSRMASATDPGRYFAPTGASKPMSALQVSHRRYSAGTPDTPPGAARQDIAATAHSVAGPSDLEEISQDKTRFEKSLKALSNLVKQHHPELENLEFGLFVKFEDSSSSCNDASPGIDSHDNPSTGRNAGTKGHPGPSPEKPSTSAFAAGRRPTVDSSSDKISSPGKQQTRSIITMMPALDAPEFKDNFRDFPRLVTQEIKKRFPETGDLKSRALHATSAENARGIMKEGFDFDRTGANLYGYSKYGSGIYTTFSSFYLVHFAKQAAGENAGAEKALQALSLYRSGPDLGEWDVDESIMLPVDTDDSQTDRGQTMGLMVPRDVALSKDTHYFITPLPPFSADMEIEKWLAEGLQKAGFPPMPRPE